MNGKTVRRADLHRAVDLLSEGLIDELIVGRELLEQRPGVVRDLSQEVHSRR